MVALSTLGSFAGLVPPITLGYLINDLVERHGVKPEDALWAALLAGAIVLEAAAYIASDGLYARNAGRLYRSLRLRMFDSVTATPAAERPDVDGGAWHSGDLNAVATERTAVHFLAGA